MVELAKKLVHDVGTHVKSSITTLAETTPLPIQRLFRNSGIKAVECAIKLASQYFVIAVFQVSI